jgi:MoaA/NifB/PqqE/SkfB family radical SAM enzyme
MLFRFKNPVRLWGKAYSLNISRLMHVSFLELKRIILNRSYIAEIDVTNKCNLKCSHCFYYKNPDYIPKGELSINEWEDKLNSIYKSGIRRLCLVGGEPALKLDVVEQANKLFPYIDICSNGQIKIPKNINHRIFISIDGNDEYNSEYRSSNILEKISKNYYNDKRVVILMTLNGKNFNMINEVADFAINNKIDSLVFSLYTPFSENDNLYFDNETRQKIINAIKQAKEKYPKLLKVNKFVLNWYSSGNHKDKCYWRDKVKHFNSLMEEREACLSMNCDYCGYFSGANIAPLNTLYRRKKSGK